MKSVLFCVSIHILSYVKSHDLICNGRVNRIVINYKDRLVRFGFELIEHICEIYDVDIIILNQTDEISFEEELVDDVLSIITVYSSKLYGKRSHKNKKIIETNKQLFQLKEDKTNEKEEKEEQNT